MNVLSTRCYSFSLTTAVLVLCTWLSPYLLGQSTDVYDVGPRPSGAPQNRGPDPAGQPALDAHLKPFRVDVDLVMVPVTVTDALNHPVANLEKEDFFVWENGKRQEIRYFSAGDEPISVGLILDFSESMLNKINTERAAVSEFLNSANAGDEYFVIGVSSRPKILADKTQSPSHVEARLASEVPAGSTALLDSIYLALTKMNSAKYQRRALLIVSDGADNNSRYRLKQIKDIAREADVQIYAIGLFDTALFKPFEEMMGRRWLQEITDATGGRTIAIDKLAELPGAASTISWELRSQYVLAYRRTNLTRHGGRREIKVKVASDAKRPLQLSYKKSYFESGR